MTPVPIQCEARQINTLLLERYSLAPNFSRSLPKHVHEDYQISLSLTDPCRHWYRGASHAAPVGFLSVLHHGEVHSAPDLFVSPEASAFHILYVPPAAMQTMTADRRGLPVHEPFFNPVLNDPALSRRFQQLWPCLMGAASQLETDSPLLLMLTQMIARHSDRKPRALLSDRGSRALAAARDYLHVHHADDLPLVALAEIAGLTPSHFCTAFRRQFGLPPHAYQTQVRIDHAKLLLARGHAPGDVAFDTGFYGPSHFGAHFKRLVGVPPGAYTRHLKP